MLTLSSDERQHRAARLEVETAFIVVRGWRPNESNCTMATVVSRRDQGATMSGAPCSAWQGRSNPNRLEPLSDIEPLVIPVS